MRKLLVAALFVASATAANAAQLLISTADTVNLPGFTTYTLSILTEGSETLRGLDATFTGSMNQVNPAGNATVFTDANGFFPFVGADVSQDSQFLVASSSVLAIGAEEGPGILKAALQQLGDNGLPNPAPLVQIATNATVDVPVEFSLAFDLGGAEPVRFAGNLPNIPEPTTCVLAGLALVGAAARRRV